MKLTITGRPASKKNSKRVFYINGRPILLPSKAYESFRKSALEQILTQKRQQFTGSVEVICFFRQKGKLNQDLDNAVSSVLDILQESGIVEDDNQVHKIAAQKIGEHADWRTEIEVRKI